MRVKVIDRRTMRIKKKKVERWDTHRNKDKNRKRNKDRERKKVLFIIRCCSN